ncbi:LuxR C-terminal-related transcriptional regulator [Aeromicrobium piscarium]|uniref:Response regulator transcription factor n=1 Tax=Aeromicrobium piscarium TaxID=2590901 RepID=A0A554SP40_9ACTN|nr:LuxR C-terminal-related transcriptional regulator [Aeromicrobium piscarium]TSD68029.1 response regulator transcription factor [Aeromicrobium piscarium]
MSSYGDRPLVLVIDDPSSLPDQIWQALDAAGVRADTRLVRALREGDLAAAERVLAASGPRLIADHPGILAPWYRDPRLRETAGPRLRWALWLDGGVVPRSLGAERGTERVLLRALRCEITAARGHGSDIVDAHAVAAAVRDAPPTVREALGPWRPVVHAACARRLVAAGDTHGALVTLAEGMASATDDDARREIGGLAVFAAAVHGDMMEARRLRQTIPSVSGVHRVDPTLAAADALIALEQGNAREARRILDRAGNEHRDLRAVDAFVLVAEGHLDDAATTRSPMDGGHPLLRALDDALMSAGTAPPRRLVDLALAQDAPRPRLHAAVRDFAAARRFAGPTTVAVLAQRVTDLVASHGMTWPLGLLSAEDGEALAALTGRLPLSFAPPARGVDLTEAEISVLRELAVGGTEAQIARRLFRSINTIKTQRRSVYRKLGVSTRADAVAIALEHGLIPAERGVNRG